MMKKLLPCVWPGPALFVLFWGTLLVGGSRFLRDPGQFWHTRVGEDTLDSGFVRTDPYTFTHAGDPWVPYQWLGEVAMALGYRAGGFDLLLVAAVALVAGLYAVLGSRFIATGLHPIFAVGVTALSLAAGSTHFHVRPHLMTMIGMAITLFALMKFERGDWSLRRVAWLIPLFWIWCNIHGGALGGLATLALAGVGFGIWKLLGWNELSWRDLFGYGLIAACCGITAFLSPYGIELVKTWLYINNGMAKLPQLIEEHAPLRFDDRKMWGFLALGAIYIGLLASTLPKRPKIAWLLPLFWFVQGFFRVRHGALFAPLAVLAMADFWPHTWLARGLAIKRPDVYSPPPVTLGRHWPRILLAGLVCVSLAFAIQQAGLTVPFLGKNCAALDSTLWPIEHDAVLAANEPKSPGQSGRVFCEYIYGAYFIHRFPGYRVFVDDRCEVFGDDFLEAYVKADEAGTAEAMAIWEDRFGRFEFALTASTDRDDGFDAYFRTRPELWDCLQRTATASFYKRR